MEGILLCIFPPIKKCIFVFLIQSILILNFSSQKQTKKIHQNPKLKEKKIINLMNDKGKPYLIEYLTSEGQLINKFKFVLNATTVSDLRDKIAEKLIGKNQLEKDQKIAIKDIDDFELGSDDEASDVVPDGRVRIYLVKNVIAQQSQPAAQPAIQQNQPVQQAAQQQPVSASQSQSSSLAAINIPILDLSNWKSPSIAQHLPKEKILKIVCPQIRKSPFSIEFNCENISFYDFSKYIIKQFNLSGNLKALLYNYEGQPLLFNLDLIHVKMPKLDLTKTFYIIFSATKTLADQVPAVPLEKTDNLVEIKIEKDQKICYTLNIDLQNPLMVLKYKIFCQSGIHPSNQIIKFAGNPLTNQTELLSGCGIKEGSIVELHFKIISNIIPASFADKFFYKDTQLIHSQDTEAYRQFKSHILAFAHHLSETDKNKMLSFLRNYTANQPLVGALRTLFFSAFLSQAHRIALQQGFYTAIWHYMNGCNPTPKTEAPFLFNHTRDFLGFIMEGIYNSKHSDAEYEKCEQTVILSLNCTLTTKPIKNPVFLKLDDGKTVLVDKTEMEDQIDKGYTYPLLKAPKKSQLFESQSLKQNYQIYRFNNGIENSAGNVDVACWVGSEQKSLDFSLPQVSVVEKYEPVIMAKNNNLKIHRALEIKLKSSIYLMLTNKEGELRIYVSKNKDINNPYNIFDVISGKEEAVNLDLMMAAGKTENLEQVVNAADLKPVITRQPKEAIVVLFDISGSMSGQFFNEPGLLRIGACKLFFEALAYRTIAYSFQHVVSLTFFDSQIEIQCDFTEAIYDFNRLVSAAKPRSTTRLYDSIVSAVNQLQNFKKRYPECILRILALTDGEDVGSASSVFDAAKAVVTNDIMMDSFAVGTNCEGLKNITLATGGKCYLTRNMEESLKLFEQETVLSVRARKVEKIDLGKSDNDIRQRLEKVKILPFDMGDSVYEYKKPQIKGPGMNSADIAKKYQSEEGQKVLSGNASLKRIAKQIQNYNENPHPFIAIFPCQNINIWKVLLVGPKQTPYQNGLFLLYVSFPGDYPFRAPEIRFITPIYHCNMNQQGRICHSVFDRNYSPALSFRHIMDCIYGLILTPEPQDPLDNVIASFFLSQYQTYLKNAKEATKKNASSSSVEIVEQIFGKIADDIERQKKVKEIQEWIDKAKACN